MALQCDARRISGGGNGERYFFSYLYVYNRCYALYSEDRGRRIDLVSVAVSYHIMLHCFNVIPSPIGISELILLNLT